MVETVQCSVDGSLLLIAGSAAAAGPVGQFLTCGPVLWALEIARIL